MRVSSVSTDSYFLSYRKKNNVNVSNIKKNDNKIKFTDKEKRITAYAVSSLVLAGLIYKMAKKPSSKPNTIENPEIKELLSSEQIISFTNQMKEFASDIAYRKKLLTGIEKSELNPAYLRPIIGPEEYKNIIKEFSSSSEHYTPGSSLITEIKDDFGQIGKIGKKFRATMHMHTKNSDGAMTVEEMLNQAATYADEVAEIIKKNSNAKAKHAPFTIAITDHDTIEGCKEAVKIISENPEKYKNLRVVLGCEMTVDSRMVSQEINSPISVHMLTHCINPFDKTLNTFFDRRKAAKLKLSEDILKEAEGMFAKISTKSTETFNIEEAKTLYKSLNDGILYPNHGLRDYLSYKAIFSESFENNLYIQNELKNKKIDTRDINFLSCRDKYFKKYIAGDKAQWQDYHKALKQYTAEILNTTEEEISKKMELTPEIIEFIEKDSLKLSNRALPKLKKDNTFIDMSDAINIIKSQETGYLTIAHPGLINPSRHLKDPAESWPAMIELFKNFKEKGGDRALAAEIHYHYYGELGKANDWLNGIAYYVKENGLLFSGGLDAHGKSIFYSFK